MVDGLYLFKNRAPFLAFGGSVVLNDLAHPNIRYFDDFLALLDASFICLDRLTVLFDPFKYDLSVHPILADCDPHLRQNHCCHVSLLQVFYQVLITLALFLMICIWSLVTLFFDN